MESIKAVEVIGIDEPKKRRRSKWDAPAAAAGADGIDNIVLSSSVVAAGTLLTQQQAVEKAFAQQALAQTMMVRATQPMFSTAVTVAAAVPAVSKLDCRIYIGLEGQLFDLKNYLILIPSRSLHYNISDADIRALFSPFGVITKVDMSLDATTGRSKGFCFVEFSEQSSAIASLDMNSFEIAGRKIKVGRPSGASNTVATTPLGTGATGAGIGVNSVPQGSGVTSSAKNQAQTLLSQALGLPNEQSNTAAISLRKTLIVRNVRNEINAAELHAVFLPFGNITFCNFIGQETLLTVLTGAVTVRSILIEYKNPVNAAECFSSMNGFNLGGVHLIVETVDQSMAAALKGSIQSIVLHNSNSDVTTKKNMSKEEKEKEKEKEVLNKNKNKNCTVILENLVSFDDASDPSLKGEIASEAEKYGRLNNIEIVVDSKKNVKIILIYFLSEDALKSYNAMNGRFFGGRTVSATLKQ